MSPIDSILHQFHATKDFSILEPVRTSSALQNLCNDEEKVALSDLFMQLAQQHLEEENPKYKNDFETAHRLLAKIPNLALNCLMKQADYVMKRMPTEDRLSEAHTIFSQAISLYHSHIARYKRAITSMYLAELTGNTDHCFESDIDFRSIALLIEVTPTAELSVEQVYAQWGRLFMLWFTLSGEPHELLQAKEKYQRAFDLGCRSTLFLQDIATAHLNLFFLFQETRYLKDALPFLEEALKGEIPDEKNDLLLVRILSLLAIHNGQEAWQEKAERALREATNRHPDHIEFIILQSQFDSVLGRFKGDLEKAERAITRLTPIVENAEYAPLIPLLAETELFVGVQNESLHMLIQAKERLNAYLNLRPDDFHGWAILAFTCIEIGHYFDERSHYQDALDHSSTGLSHSKEHAPLWHARALAYLAIGDQSGEERFYQKGNQCFERASRLSHTPYSSFANDWGTALMKLWDISQQPLFLKQAITQFERVLQTYQMISSPPPQVLLLNYGSALHFLGQAEEDEIILMKAIDVLSSLVSTDPEHAQSLHTLGLTFFEWGELSDDPDHYRTAILYLKQSLESDPEEPSTSIHLGIALITLALLERDPYQQEKEKNLFKEAETHFLRANALGYHVAWYQLACLYSIMGDYSLSIQSLEKAKQLKSLPDWEELCHDEWLEGVRSTQEFRSFLNSYHDS